MDIGPALVSILVDAGKSAAQVPASLVARHPGDYASASPGQQCASFPSPLKGRRSAAAQPLPQLHPLAVARNLDAPMTGVSTDEEFVTALVIEIPADGALRIGVDSEYNHV